MEIIIDTADKNPIFNQLIDQIKQGVRNGVLIAGTPLPSIRQLANDLGINQNTVAKAYRMLERDNIIETLGYRGTFIHKQANDHCDIDLMAVANQTLTDAVNQLKDKGLTDSEIRQAFTKALKGEGHE